MSFFIQNAYADIASSANQQPSMIGQVLMLVAFVAVFYFLIWRPQAKRNKELRQLLDNLAVGNEVVFAGGLMGTIKKIEGDYAVIALNSHNEVKVQKGSIIAVLPEGTLAKL